MSDQPKCLTLGLAPSFGFGDRIGLATPGHVEAMKRSANGIEPIFPQQSIREMTRTERTPQQVMDDALGGALERPMRLPKVAAVESSISGDRAPADGYDD